MVPIGVVVVGPVVDTVLFLTTITLSRSCGNDFIIDAQKYGDDFEYHLNNDTGSVTTSILADDGIGSFGSRTPLFLTSATGIATNVLKTAEILTRCCKDQCNH